MGICVAIKIGHGIMQPAMPTTLKELLTETPTEDGKPLFPTAAALGEAIVSQEASGYTNARSVGTLISFMFRGKRSCPGTLRDEILKVTRARLTKQAKRVQDDWVQRIGRTIDFLNSEVSKAQETRSLPDDEQFERLLERAESAKWHFIITPLTAEQEDGVDRADRLNQALLRHLGLEPRNTASPLTQYWFLLPDAETAALFWKELEQKAQAATGDDVWVQERLASLDDKDFIQVYIVPPFVCGCPLVVYDPEKSRDATAFSFSHHPANVIDTIQWDHKSVEKWQANVFKAFVPVKSETAAKEVMKNNPSKFPGYRCPFPSRASK